MSNSDETVRATVKVEFVMEFKAGPWGMDCKMDQVVGQATREAEAAARQLLHGSTGKLLRVVKIGAPSIHMPARQQKP